MLPSLTGKMASFMGTFVSCPAPPTKPVYEIATEARDADWRESPRRNRVSRQDNQTEWALG
jgi:hypothetical protein